MKKFLKRKTKAERLKELDRIMKKYREELQQDRIIFNP
jgi:hypothetical protein